MGNWILIVIKAMSLYILVRNLLDVPTIIMFGREQFIGSRSRARSVDAYKIGLRAYLTLPWGGIICLFIGANLIGFDSVTPYGAFGGCLVFFLLEMDSRFKQVRSFENSGHLQAGDEYKKTIMPVIILTLVNIGISYINLKYSFLYNQTITSWINWAIMGPIKWIILIIGGIATISYSIGLVKSLVRFSQASKEMWN